MLNHFSIICTPRVFFNPLPFGLERKQEELDEEAENIRDIITHKEHDISVKEDEVN